MHVLLFRVEDEKSAVVVDRGEVYADAPELVKYDRLAEHAEVARHNQIVVRRYPPQVAEMCLHCVDGCGCHGRAHVVGVLDAVILNFSDGCGLNARPVPAFSHNAAARAGDGPLGSRRTLSAVTEREAVLPLCRGEV